MILMKQAAIELGTRDNVAVSFACFRFPLKNGIVGVANLLWHCTFCWCLSFASLAELNVRTFDSHWFSQSFLTTLAWLEIVESVYLASWFSWNNLLRWMCKADLLWAALNWLCFLLNFKTWSSRFFFMILMRQSAIELNTRDNASVIFACFQTSLFNLFDYSRNHELTYLWSKPLLDPLH